MSKLSNPDSNLISLLQSSQFKSIQLGLLLSKQRNSLPQALQNEIVLIAYLHEDTDLRQKAYDCLVQFCSNPQIEHWDTSFELFEIAYDLYDKSTLESHWHLFEQHEPERIYFMKSILNQKIYVQRYYHLAQCICNYYRKKMDWAAKYMEMLISHAPTNLNNLFLTANFYYHDLLDAAKAQFYFEKMLQIDPCHEEALTGVALLQNDFFQNPTAGLAYLHQKADAPIKDSIILLQQVLSTYLPDLQRVQQAYTNLQKYTQGNSYYYEALSARAYTCKNQLYDPKTAKTLYEEILEYNPNDFYALAALAELHGAAVFNQPREATKLWKRAFSVYMDDPHYLVKYITFLMLDVDEKEAAESYLEYLNEFCYKDIRQEEQWRFYKLNTEDRARFDKACQLILNEQ